MSRLRDTATTLPMLEDSLVATAVPSQATALATTRSTIIPVQAQGPQTRNVGTGSGL